MTTVHFDPITGLDTLIPDGQWVDVVVGSRDGLPTVTPSSIEFGAFVGAVPDVVKLDWFSAQLFSDLWRQSDSDARDTIRALIPRLAAWGDELKEGA